MEKQKPAYEDFLKDVPPTELPFVDALHTHLLANGCTAKVELAKNGYVVSYPHTRSKRVLLNYVFRKEGLVIRLYGDHLPQYAQALQALPESMKKRLAKASVCRRMADPTKCNARCPMGYVFTLAGAEHKKCRYSCLMFPVTQESQNALRDLVKRELEARGA